MNKKLEQIIEKTTQENLEQMFIEWGEYCAQYAWLDRLSFFHKDFYKWWKNFLKDEKVNTDTDIV